MPYTLVFPGQGSQFVGMGKDLADAFTVAKEVFVEVNDALHENLTQLMFSGDADELTLTKNTQPALMAVSMAIVRVLQYEGRISLAETIRYAAGHSLGEYTALCAAGAMSITTCAQLLRQRGLAMQEAVPVGKGGMVALIGADMEVAQSIATEAAEKDVCVAANDNAPGQVVLSGDMAAIDRAVEIAKQKGLKRALKLNVSAPFHSPLMAPAAKVMKEALDQAEIHDLNLPVIANVSAKPIWKQTEIRPSLVQQITGTVRWRESMMFAKQSGVDTLVEIGAGKVLTGLAKRIDPEFNTVTLNTPAEIEEFMKQIG